MLTVGFVALSASAQDIDGWDGDPYAETLTLSANFSGDPRTVDVRPGGSRANPLDGPGCVGYIGMRPDVVVNYTVGDWALTFSAASDTDINLVVRTPDGRYLCDDDSGEGTNPVVTVSKPTSGAYRAWVGVYSSAGEYVDGVFGVSEVGEEVSMGTSSGTTTPRAIAGASGEVSGWSSEPYFGSTTVSAGFSGDPRTVAINAGGSQANPLSGSGCVGYIGMRPDHVLNYSAGIHTLTLSAAASTDLNLVVRTPGGRYLCDDDSGEGLNPRIDIEDPESGAYVLWVGTYSNQDSVIESTLGISEIGIEAE